MAETKHPAVILTVKFKSTLPREEAEKVYKERLPQFRALPGLLQKYYVYDSSTDEWAGIYLWDSQASFDEYMESDLRKSIPGSYKLAGPARIEILTVVDVLRAG